MNIKDLFENIGYEFRNENNLSDFVMAFCNYSDDFFFTFMKFFFSNFSEEEEIIEFRREYAKNSSRPDFYCKSDKQEYIIEVKINDKNHHFEQYQDKFTNAKFGYIANYNLPIYENVETRTWSDFYHYLEEIKKTKKNTDIDLTECFLSYLKVVCNIIKIGKMNLSNLSSLSNFHNLINKVINSLENYHSPDFDNKVSNIDYNRYGKYFSLTKLNSDYTIWPWLGVFFNEENVVIYIEVNRDWCEKEFNYLENKKLSDGKFFKAPYYDEDYRASYCFEMKEEVLDEFNNSDTVDKQEDILKNFLMETINAIND